MSMDGQLWADAQDLCSLLSWKFHGLFFTFLSSHVSAFPFHLWGNDCTAVTDLRTGGSTDGSSYSRWQALVIHGSQPHHVRCFPGDEVCFYTQLNFASFQPVFCLVLFFGVTSKAWLYKSKEVCSP